MYCPKFASAEAYLVDVEKRRRRAARVRRAYIQRAAVAAAAVLLAGFARWA